MYYLMPALHANDTERTGHSSPSIFFLRPRSKGTHSMKKKYSCITQTNTDDKGNASWANTLPARCFRRQTQENSIEATRLPKVIIGQCTPAYTASYVFHARKPAHPCVRGEHLTPRRWCVVDISSEDITWAYLLRKSYRRQMVIIHDVQCVQGSDRSRKQRVARLLSSCCTPRWLGRAVVPRRVEWKLRDPSPRRDQCGCERLETTRGTQKKVDRRCCGWERCEE
jgi:hypothetical protein